MYVPTFVLLTYSRFVDAHSIYRQDLNIVRSRMIFAESFYLQKEIVISRILILFLTVSCCWFEPLTFYQDCYLLLNLLLNKFLISLIFTSKYCCWNIIFQLITYKLHRVDICIAFARPVFPHFFLIAPNKYFLLVIRFLSGFQAIIVSRNIVCSKVVLE